MLTQTFSKVLILADYEANKDFISTYLCLNRAKPELKCNGKCYLSQKLKKAEQTEKDASQNNQKKQVEITLFYQELLADAASYFPSGLPLALPQVFPGKTTCLSFSIFHPPQVTV